MKKKILLYVMHCMCQTLFLPQGESKKKNPHPKLSDEWAFYIVYKQKWHVSAKSKTTKCKLDFQNKVYIVSTF